MLIFCAVQKVFGKMDLLILILSSILDLFLNFVMIVEGEGMRIEHLVFICGDQSDEGVSHDHEAGHGAVHLVEAGQIVPRRCLVDISCQGPDTSATCLSLPVGGIQHVTLHQLI